jgi:hypothetical protein
VRLDHLLSKEHLAAKAVQEIPPPSVGWGARLAETLVSSCRQRPIVEYGPSGCGKRSVRLVWVVSILLGPERTSACTWCVGFVFRCRPAAGDQTAQIFGLWPSGLWSGVRVCGSGGGGVGLLFENCTVDASIFVVKLPRANGGCLGTRSR